MKFLSPQWMAMLAHTTSEAKRLGLGVDMTTGTGWPFGGPQVTPEIASAGLEVIHQQATGGTQVSIALPKGNIPCLRAFPETGAPIDLTGSIKDGKLEWLPPAGKWNIVGLGSRSPIQKVKRAAPGGEGNVLDPFSGDAMTRYLAAFDKAFGKFAAPLPRAQFHDSFEYYAAGWTPALFEKFLSARGYDLRDQLPAFAGIGDPDTVSRVRADYRETLSELHLAYLQCWHDWAKSRGGITRNQAHGSPGNLLDHYAVSEIPETEIFRQVDEKQIPMMRIAASAAHSKGDNLVSAETFTWLDEHFQVTPEKLKEAADFVFLGGVNLVQGGWPGEVPGFHLAQGRSERLLAVETELDATQAAVQATDSILPALARLGVLKESMTAAGLRFVRRSHAGGYHYFIVNRSDKTFDGILPLAVPFQSAVILDPWNLTRTGTALPQDSGVALRLAPGQSIIIRTYTDRKIEGKRWTDAPTNMQAVAIAGPWKLEFIEGGPTLPAPATNLQPGSWTSLPDAANFSGTARYTTTFISPTALAAGCWIDLGRVANTARVSINGQDLGISWCAPHLIDVSRAIKPGENHLDIEVTNLAANRIADLDRRKVPWKKFHEINFVNIDYKLFDAASWPARESGLLGSVRLLVPMRR